MLIGHKCVLNYTVIIIIFKKWNYCLLNSMIGGYMLDYDSHNVTSTDLVK